MVKVKARDLKLADVVTVFDGPFGTAVVKKIDDDVVTLFRPYATTADFSYTGGVIPYIGIEEVRVFKNDDTFTVHERKEVK